jgi:hypothetical protein
MKNKYILGILGAMTLLILFGNVSAVCENFDSSKVLYTCGEDLRCTTPSGKNVLVNSKVCTGVGVCSETSVEDRMECGPYQREDIKDAAKRTIEKNTKEIIKVVTGNEGDLELYEEPTDSEQDMDSLRFSADKEELGFEDDESLEFECVSDDEITPEDDGEIGSEDDDEIDEVSEEDNECTNSGYNGCTASLSPLGALWNWIKNLFS